MRYTLFHKRALALPGATYATKFGDRRTFCVGGKMFAMAGRLGERAPLYGFKASPMAFDLLVDAGLARPMPYLQRAKWVELLGNESSARGRADGLRRPGA